MGTLCFQKEQKDDYLLTDRNISVKKVKMSVEEQVTESLFQFLQSHVSELKVEDIDEIVLSYVVSILQDLTSGSYMDEEAFDVDAFCETLFAYMPQTEVIPPIEITEWMFTLARDHREKCQAESRIQLDLKSVIEDTVKKGRKSSESSLPNEDTICQETASEKKRNARISESSDYSNSDVDNDDYKQLVNQLMEMFPSACALEVSHCLTMMSGSIDSAAQLIMHRQESGQSLLPTDFKEKRAKKKEKVDDKSVKDAIMHKYGYVDQPVDARYHRPTLKREDDKKMIRYRDGKIVSTKGERYTQVTKAESEEM